MRPPADGNAQRIRREARRLLEHAEGAHDASHAERVERLAFWIIQQEGLQVEPLLVTALAWLHDTLDPKLRVADEAFINQLLEETIPGEARERFWQSLKHVSYRERRQGLQPLTREGWLLHDADKLDALGAIGIARAFAYGGSVKRRLYTPGEKGIRTAYPAFESGFMHLFEKLLHLPGLIHYPSAKRLAEQRARFIRLYAKTFLKEWYLRDAERLSGE